ncbi:MAG: hypothetical protein HY816_15660 [Candidatus Wallbacteria bacterium]|nr:hypothetical protein [Candidatus Wallbacteria bacterium]
MPFLNTVMPSGQVACPGLGGDLQLFLPGLTPDFDIEAGRGYVVSVSAPTELLLPSCEP